MTAFLLTSCASGPDLSNPKIRAAISKVRFFKSGSLLGKKVSKIKTLKTSICLTNGASSGNSSEESAKVELRFLASQLGAKGLTNYMCHSKGLNMSTNCWNSSECYADAITFN
jgi:hypothetical protein